MTKDYRIEVKVRNNLLLEKIEKAGYDTVAAFCQASGMKSTTVYAFINLKVAPIHAYNGNFSASFLKIMDFLGCFPEDIFPKAQMKEAMKVNRLSSKVNIEDVKNLTTSMRSMALPPEQKMLLDEARSSLSEMMGQLTPREHRVLNLTWGLNGVEEHTYKKAGEVLGISTERIRQIQNRAMRKLKEKDTSKKLRGALHVFDEVNR